MGPPVAALQRDLVLVGGSSTSLLSVLRRSGPATACICSTGILANGSHHTRPDILLNGKSLRSQRPRKDRFHALWVVEMDRGSRPMAALEHADAVAKALEEGLLESG